MVLKLLQSCSEPILSPKSVNRKKTYLTRPGMTSLLLWAYLKTESLDKHKELLPLPPLPSPNDLYHWHHPLHNQLIKASLQF